MGDKSLKERAIKFYTLFGEKNIEAMESYLDPNMSFVGPMAQFTGREAYLDSAKKFSQFFTGLTIRAAFEDGHQAMLAYDFDCPPPIGKFQAAVLLTFEKELIIKVELFYDARPFDVKKSEIF